MANYIKFYVNPAEINQVMEGLKKLSEKRLITKFAKTIGVSQSLMSALVLGKRDLSKCTLIVYNKIVSNIDTFLAEYEEKENGYN